MPCRRDGGLQETPAPYKCKVVPQICEIAATAHALAVRCFRSSLMLLLTNKTGRLLQLLHVHLLLGSLPLL